MSDDEPANLIPPIPGSPYGVFVEQTAFWVVHRRQYYGPFDYQWSNDLRGIELLYRGEKYGECASDEEFFADLEPHLVPQKVALVAAVVSGSIVKSIFGRSSHSDRNQEIQSNLDRSNLSRYLLQVDENS